MVGVISVRGSALKASIMDGMFCSCLNFIFLSAWYFWIHCCLSICPLMLSEEKQSVSQLMTPSRHWKNVKVILHAMNGSFLSFFFFLVCITTSEWHEKSQWIMLLWVFVIPVLHLSLCSQKGSNTVGKWQLTNKPMGATVNLQVWLLTGWEEAKINCLIFFFFWLTNIQIRIGNRLSGLLLWKLLFFHNSSVL